MVTDRNSCLRSSLSGAGFRGAVDAGGRSCGATSVAAICWQTRLRGATPNVGPCGARRALLAVALALACAWAQPARGQGEAADGFRPFLLRHLAAAEVEPRLEELFAGHPQPAEVVVDPRTNRLLVRGTPAQLTLVARYLAAVDRASGPPAEPELRTYPLAAAQLEPVAAALRAEFAAQPDVRISADRRTQQLIVVAPPEVHAALAPRLGAGPGSAAPVAAAPPVGPAPPASAATVPSGPAAPPLVLADDARVVTLAATTWPLVEGRLARGLQDKFRRLPPAGDGHAAAELNFAAQGAVRLTVSPDGRQVGLRGPAPLVERTSRLLAALDLMAQTPGREAQLVGFQGDRRESLARAAAAVGLVEGPAQADAAGERRAVPLVAHLFQPAAPANSAAPAQPTGPPNPMAPAVPAAPGVPGGPPTMGTTPNAPPGAGPAPAAGAAAAAGTNGLLGPVQIEFLDGMDVMIVSGNQRDVERVLEILQQIEQLATETTPAIEVVVLKHVGSEAVTTIVKQLNEELLTARQGEVSVTALVKPNAVLLVGRAEAVTRVGELLARLDVPVDPATEFIVYPLKFASAAAVQATIEGFFSERAGLGTKVVVTSDVRTNAVIVQASPRDQAEVARLITQIDQETTAAENELRVFPLKNALADDLAPVLQAALLGEAAATGQTGLGAAAGAVAGQPGAAGTTAAASRSAALKFLTIDARGQRQLKSGILTEVRITSDPRANALLVAGPASSMELIEALVRQLDQSPAAVSQIKVFTIVNGDASALVEMLEALFGSAQRTAAGGGFGVGALGQSNYQGENPLVPLRFSVDQRTNSIIASGGAEDLQVVEAILLKLDASDVRQRENTVYRLRNAPALDVANAINEFLRSEREVQQANPALLSPFEQIEREVVVVPEQVSNSLIVSATPRYYDEIRKIVEELDARPPMVMIQVLIAEVKLDNTDEFGVELGLQDSVLFDRSLVGDLVTVTNSTQLNNMGAVQTTTNQQIVGASNTPGFLFNSPNLGNSASDRALANSNTVGGQGLTNFSVGRINNELGFGGLVLSASSEAVSVLIRALKEARRLDVLSRPQVMTLDNQPAFVQVGSRVPRVQGVTVNQSGQVSNVTDVNVGLILGVTPRISPDGIVVMEVDAERSAVGPEDEGVPISVSATGEVVRQPLINTTTAQTTVSAVSGQTVVLGGLITKSRSQTRRRVPGLSQIPILGHLFRYDADVVERTELLIVLTPHVVRTEEDAEYLKQIEAARMSWCLSDVVAMHGDLGLGSRHSDWADGTTRVVYPHVDPRGDGTPAGELVIPGPANAGPSSTGELSAPPPAATSPDVAPSAPAAPVPPSAPGSPAAPGPVPAPPPAPPGGAALLPTDSTLELRPATGAVYGPPPPGYVPGPPPAPPGGPPAPGVPVGYWAPPNP